VHRFFSNLKVWMLGVYHGLRRQHVQSYLDEFVFRFNRGRARHAAFRSLLGIAAAHAPLSYKMLIAPEAAEKALSRVSIRSWSGAASSPT
jgi:hypothetical protein